MPARLRACPECGNPWPKDASHALRGCGWLHGLSRNISPNNGDVEIHDGIAGRARFLRLEIKGPKEAWPIRAGQMWHLAALAAQPNWTVRILRGTTREIDMYRVTADGVSANAVKTHAEAVRRAVDAWLQGASWQDAARAHLASEAAADHTCGWARVDGIWTCIQDHYAVGPRSDTACGRTLEAFA